MFSTGAGARAETVGGRAEPGIPPGRKSPLGPASGAKIPVSRDQLSFFSQDIPGFFLPNQAETVHFGPAAGQNSVGTGVRARAETFGGRAEPGIPPGRNVPVGACFRGENPRLARSVKFFFAGYTRMLYLPVWTSRKASRSFCACDTVSCAPHSPRRIARTVCQEERWSVRAQLLIL